MHEHLVSAKELMLNPPAPLLPLPPPPKTTRQGYVQGLVVSAVDVLAEGGKGRELRRAAGAAPQRGQGCDLLSCPLLVAVLRRLLQMAPKTLGRLEAAEAGLAPAPAVAAAAAASTDVSEGRGAAPTGSGEALGWVTMPGSEHWCQSHPRLPPLPFRASLPLTSTAP